MTTPKNSVTHSAPIDLDFDSAHIWHPYTSMSEPLPCYPVVSAEGVKLQLEDGRELIDGMSSWWAVLHGYNHPVMNEAIKAQLEKVSHVMFGGITHQPAVDLVKKGDYQCAFFLLSLFQCHIQHFHVMNVTGFLRKM